MVYSKKMHPFLFILASFLCVCSVVQSPPLQAEPATLGWLESFYLPGERMVAKLDTGAKTSSVHAKNIEILEKDGRPWVSFTIPSKNPEYPGILTQSRKNFIENYDKNS